MLTFTYSGKTSVRITGGSLPVTFFPDAPVSGGLSLLPSPQEFPSREVISWPGEYDVGGITVRGIGHKDGQKVSFLTEIDGIRIAFPASPPEDWSDHDLEQLGDVHVLVMTAEDPKRFQKMLDDIDPRVLILTPAADGTIDQDVLKACGAVGQEQASEYKMKGSLPQEGRDVVVFG